MNRGERNAAPLLNPAPQSKRPSEIERYQKASAAGFKPVDASKIKTYTGSKPQPVSITMNPQTRMINIAAPQYYLDSPEFKNQVLPYFQQLKGKPVSTEQFNTLMNSDMLKQIQQQADDVKARIDNLQWYKKNYQYTKDATDKDALIALRNTAMGQVSPKDSKSQIIIGVNKDGSYQTQSVKDALKNLNSYSDEDKAKMVKKTESIINDPNTNQIKRAINVGLLNFYTQQGALEASTGTKIQEGLNSFVSNFGDSFIGKAANLLMEPGQLVAGDNKSFVDRAKSNADLMANLEGTEGARAIGGVAGQIGGLGADVIAAGPLSELALAGAAAGASRIPGGVRAVEGTSDAINALSKSGKAGEIAAKTVKGVPQELAFGTEQAVANGNYSPEDFAIDTAANAAMLGGGKLLARGAKTLENSKSVREANDALSHVITKGLDTAEVKLPGAEKVRDAVSKFRIKFTNRGAQITRKALTKAASEDDRASLTKVRNILADVNSRGSNLANDFKKSVGDLGARIASNEQQFASGKLNDEFTDYAVARAKLNDSTHGVGAKLSKDQVEEYQATLDKYSDNEIFKQTYDDLSEYSRKAQDYFGNEESPIDPDKIAKLRENEDYAKNWIHLERKPNSESKKLFKKRTRPQDITAIHGTKAVAHAYESPLKSAINMVGDYANKTAINRARLAVADLIRGGYIAGHIAWEPSTKAARDALRSGLKGEEKFIDDLFTDAGKNWGQQLASIAEDIDNFASPAVGTLEKKINDIIDESVKLVQKDPAFKETYERMVDELGGHNLVNDRNAALEILSSYQKRYLEHMYDAMNKTLSSEDADMVKGMVSQELNGETQLSRAIAGNKTVKDTDEFGKSFRRGVETRDDLRASGYNRLTSPEISERKKAWQELNKEIGESNKSDPKTVVFYQGGKEGRMYVEDPLVLRYFTNGGASPAMDGFISRLLTGSSRIFRLGTTSTPDFVFFRNLPRDVQSQLMLNSFNFAEPKTTMQLLVEEFGSKEQARELVQRFENNLSYSTRYDITSRNEHLFVDDMIERSHGVDKIKLITKNGIKHHKLDALEYPGQKFEKGIRTRGSVIRYLQAKAQGMSEEDAIQEGILYGKEATAAFHNRGENMEALIRTIPFFNAAIQGSESFLRLWRLEPLSVTTRLAVGIAAPTIYLTANNLRDDETAAAYFDIPEWERSSKFIIMLDKDNKIEIPMSQEFASVVNPLRSVVEFIHGSDENLFKSMADGLLGNLPVDLSGFTETGVDGGINYKLGTARAIGSFVPQVAKPIYAITTGKDLYTGAPIMPDDQLGDAADQTFASRNSKILGAISNITHIPQGYLQAVVKGYGSTGGEEILNALDTLVGAPENERGGKSLAENVSKTIFGSGVSQSQMDFYDGVSDLTAEKDKVQKKLSSLATQEAYASGDDLDSLEKQRQAVIKKYGDKVTDFAKKYGEYYKRAGGLKPAQLNTIINLYNMNTIGATSGMAGAGANAPDDYRTGDMNTVAMEGRNDALERYNNAGLPTSNDRDRYGRLYVDENGNPTVNYSGTSLSNQIIKNAVYGAPKQAAYDFSQAMKANKQTGQKSMYDEAQPYWDKIDKLYDEAKGKKGKAATAIYEQINDLQEKYMTEVFDKRIKPLIDKYGPSVLLNNNDIFKEISSYIMVPGDFTPFTSRKKQPYQKDDVEAYLKDRYGVGRLNQENLPTDAEATAIINKANADLNNGRRGAAQYKLNSLTNMIDSGKVYVDKQAMERIKQMLAIANRY